MGVGSTPTSQAMLPPPPRRTGVKPPAGKKTLQQQAVLAAAAAAQSGAVGTLGTIPDEVPFDAAGEPVSSTSGQAIPEYSLSKWDQYFDSIADLQIEDRHGVFRIYQAGTEGPVVFCLHGGGYSGLTWALLAKQLKGVECWLLTREAMGALQLQTMQTCQLRHLCWMPLLFGGGY